MRPETPPQLVLFDLHPEGQEPPVAHRAITPGCLLPVPPSSLIDIQRTCNILDVSVWTVHDLIKRGKIDGFQLGAKSSWRITYLSVVEFCDALRLEHAIVDRRPKLRPGGRWRDSDLLPFPTLDTVAVDDAMVGLDLHRKGVIHLIQEGAFEAYAVTPGSPWRISKTSLFRFRDRKKIELRQARNRR